MKGLILTTLVLLYSGNVYACTCVGGLSPEERIASVEYIFLAEVADITPTEDRSGLLPHDEFEVKLSVIETWKGSVGSEVYALMNYMPGSSCGASFKLGYHVVVLVDDLNRPEFHACKHNAWTLEEDEIEEVREFVISELLGLPVPQ